MPSPSSWATHLTSEAGQIIQKWIIYQSNLNYIKFAFKWDPIQFEDHKHLQKYEETNGSISYLKSNTVKQLVSLKIHMILLICQDRPADQNYHPTHFSKGDQLFKLTAIDRKTALLNELFDNPRSKTTFRAQDHTPFIFCIYEVSYPCGAWPIQERYQIR